MLFSAMHTASFKSPVHALSLVRARKSRLIAQNRIRICWAITAAPVMEKTAFHAIDFIFSDDLSDAVCPDAKRLYLSRPNTQVSNCLTY